MNQLVGILVKKHGFVEADSSVVLPQPEVRLKPLTEEELDGALSSLPGWEPVESVIPGDYPNSRYELRRAYRFKSFKSAIKFMEAAVDPINKVQHHPRWENQWRTVTVYLSTWDIGNKISTLDVELAQTLDTLYGRHRGTQGSTSKSLS